MSRRSLIHCRRPLACAACKRTAISRASSSMSESRAGKEAAKMTPVSSRCARLSFHPAGFAAVSTAREVLTLGGAVTSPALRSACMDGKMGQQAEGRVRSCLGLVRRQRLPHEARANRAGDSGRSACLKAGGHGERVGRIKRLDNRW